MPEPRLAKIVVQYVRNHGFDIHYYSGVVYKNDIYLGAVHTNEDELTIAFLKDDGALVVSLNVYDPDSFPKLIDALRAAYSLSRLSTM